MLQSPEHNREILKQEFLGNVAFQRFADALLLYYDMVKASEGGKSESYEKDSVPDKETLKIRMDEIKDLFTMTLLTGAGKKVFKFFQVGDPEKIAPNTEALVDNIIDEINNTWGDMDVPRKHGEKIDRNSIAANLSRSLNAEHYLRAFKRQTMEKPTEGIKKVNEVVNYHFVNPETISIHLAVTSPNMNVSDLVEFMKTGFSEVVEKLKGTKVNKVVMASWLFAPRFSRILKQIFPNGDLLVDDYKNQSFTSFAVDTIDVERNALVYNQQMLKEYLLEGSRPEIYRVELSLEDLENKLK